MAGEYTAQVMGEAIGAFVRQWIPDMLAPAVRASNAAPALEEKHARALAEVVPPRPPGFCIGCPERPIFAAMKLVERELGPHHVAADIGCHLFAIMPPFNIGTTTMGYGLGPASASAFNVKAAKRSIAVMGDGGFWHNGLTSGIGNAVFNKSDGVVLIVDNHYSAATGGQDLLSSRAANRSRSTRHAIADAVKGMGVNWVRQIDRTYDVGRMRDTLKEALTSDEPGPKVIVAASECMLNRQRRERPLFAKAVKAGKRMVRQRFGVDEDVCTGDHACIRLSGCPSLSVKQTADPLKDDPVAAIDNSCVGCGNCGDVAEAAVLCPSFYRADIIINPTGWDRAVARTARGRHRLLPAPARPAAAAAGLTRWTPSISSPTLDTRRPIAIAVMAMGGQGGGVLVDWIVALIEGQGWLAQSTSVPGVAQRTGATIYYVEAIESDGSGRRPVLSLMPVPGEVDIVIGAELMEAGRAMQRGLVSPDRTTLIASSHRAYAVSEKIAPGDGAGDPAKVHEAARAASKQFLAFDMAAIAEQSESVISAALFGALAASGALPFPRAAYEATIREAGFGVEASLRAFGRAYDAAVAELKSPTPAPRVSATRKEFPELRPIGDAGFDALVERARKLPEPRARHGRGRPGARRGFPGRRLRARIPRSSRSLRCDVGRRAHARPRPSRSRAPWPTTT